MNLNRTWKVSRCREKTEAPRAWRSQRRDLPEAQACCQPDMTLGQPRSPLCTLGRTMNLSPPPLLFLCRETLLLPGVPLLTFLVADGRLYLHLTTPMGSP